MAEFPPAVLCTGLPALGSIEDICLPGGVCLSYIWNATGQIPSLSDMALDFMGQLGPALTPLVPFFNLLDTVVQVYNCVSSIPDIITTLDPTELLNCIPALAKLVDQLLKLIPQLSIPKMVIAALKNLASLLRGVATDLDNLVAILEAIALQIDRAAELNDHTMNGFLVCSQETVERTALSTGEALKGIGQIVLLLNVFIGLFGGEPIPCFSGLIKDNIGEGLDVVIDLLYALADVLETLARAIPDPDLALTLALGKQEC